MHGKHVVIESDDLTARVWSQEEGGTQQLELTGLTESESSVCATPDGEHVVAESDDLIDGARVRRTMARCAARAHRAH